jgi:regulatory protein
MRDPASSLRVRALRFLARRDHSREELKRKLAADGDADEIDRLLDDFERKGWLSESRLADQMVRAARGRYGTRHVIERLSGKGVQGEALERAAQALQSHELESARLVWRKRFGQRPSTLQEKARQARFLAGRGFSAEVIHRLLGEDPDTDS